MIDYLYDGTFEGILTCCLLYTSGDGTGNTAADFTGFVLERI